MTGAQLKELRRANGLSERQFAKMLGFGGDSRSRESYERDGKLSSSAFNSRNPSKKLRKLEEKPFVPEPIVIRINAMVTEGKLIAR